MPVSSLMSSARPARTSSVDSAMVFLLVGCAGCAVVESDVRMTEIESIRRLTAV
jgi:hypothetical protein